MNKSKGITLISLTITVVILLILAGTVTYSGIHVYENMLVENFISEMKVIQEKVNLTCEKFELLEYTDLETYLVEKEIINDKTDITKAGTLNDEVSAFVGENLEDYQYFDSELLEKNLDIKNLEQEVIINFNTREVISLKGVKKDDKTYYRQYDLPGGDKIIEYNKIQGSKKNLISIEKYIYGLSAKLKIYSTNSDIKTIYYGEMIEKDEKNNPIVSNWNRIGEISQQYEINIIKTGDYVVKAEDSHGNTDTQIINVTLVNSPDLSSELIPIKYDNDSKQWVIAKENDGTWYDYNNGNGTSKWANAMLSDGRYKNKNGVFIDTKNTASTSDDVQIDLDNTQITLEESDMGSVFVWIPRYMYEIEQVKNEDGSYNNLTGCKKSESGTINIKFLKGTTDIPTDDTIVKCTDTLGNEKWLVHSAFKDGKVNNFSNGEWNEEIKGIWVSKYEVSRSDATTVDIGESETLKVASKLKKLNNISIIDMYDKSINFNKNLNSHMMKNSEYGALVYLSYSKYGTNKSKIGNTESSTKNEYGIYNLNDEVKEVVSAFYINEELEETAIFSETNGGNKSTKHITINSINNNRYGDAVIETSENNESWDSTENSKYPDEQRPYMVRGISNIFNYNATDGQENLGFRIVLINK